VDVVVITDEGVEDPAQLDEMAPVLVGAEQPGELPAEDDAHLAAGHRGQQAVEAVAGGRAQRGAPAQVGVDDVHVPPAQPARMIREGVLQPLKTIARFSIALVVGVVAFVLYQAPQAASAPPTIEQFLAPGTPIEIASAKKADRIAWTRVRARPAQRLYGVGAGVHAGQAD